MRSPNVILLAVAASLSMAGASLVVLVGGIVGIELAPSPRWATLPVALMTVGVALSSIPAALVMRRVGRRNGFILSSLVAMLAMLLAAYAIYRQSFALLCIAILFIGSNLAFVQQYRFAAAESAPATQVSRAVSLVLLGGVVAGFLGPEIVKQTRDWLPYGAYSGPFVVMSMVYGLVALLLLFLRPVALREEEATGAERPLRRIVSQPGYLVAVLAAIVGYGVMTFIMTATPISMHVMDGHSLEATGTVIQSHAIAMYLPSLVTGILIARAGLTRVMMGGVLALLACVGLAVSGHALHYYWGALVLLGVGWNFLFVSGTVLLTASYHPSERFKAQATNDFTVFAIQATSSLAAGGAIQVVSWEVLNLLTVPALLLMALAVFLYHRQSTRSVATSLAS